LSRRSEWRRQRDGIRIGCRSGFDAILVRREIYRLDPERIVLIDNKKGFGHKETLELKGVPITCGDLT
jgi:hypothetical protein